MTLIPHRCRTKKGMGHRPSQKEDGTFKDSNQSKHFTESLKLVTTSSISDPAINHDSPVLSGSKS